MTVEHSAESIRGKSGLLLSLKNRNTDTNSIACILTPPLLGMNWPPLNC